MADPIQGQRSPSSSSSSSSRSSVSSSVFLLFLVFPALLYYFSFLSLALLNALFFILPTHKSLQTIQQAQSQTQSQTLTLTTSPSPSSSSSSSSSVSLSSLRVLLIYWLFYSFLELFDFALVALPAYAPAKLIALAFCLAPQLRGAETLYSCLLRPLFHRHSRTIESSAHLIAHVVRTVNDRRKSVAGTGTGKAIERENKKK